MELHERLSSVSTAAATTPSANGRDPFAEVKNRIHLMLVSDLGPQLFDVSDHDEARERAMAEIREQLQQEPQLSRSDRERLAREISDDVFGYGPLEQLISDPSISEIMVNGHRQVWIERDGRIAQTELQFADEAQLRRIITKMVGQVGRRIDESSPMVDARLPDGSRVNAIISPLSLSGPLLTIRRFSAERFGLEELVRIGTMSQESCDFLCSCIRAELNLLISGGSGGNGDRCAHDAVLWAQLRGQGCPHDERGRVAGERADLAHLVGGVETRRVARQPQRPRLDPGGPIDTRQSGSRGRPGLRIVNAAQDCIVQWQPLREHGRDRLVGV